MVTKLSPRRRNQRLKKLLRGAPGEAHWNCRISDAMVDYMHELHAAGLGARRIAATLMMPLGTVAKILDGSRRVARWREVEVSSGK